MSRYKTNFFDDILRNNMAITHDQINDQQSELTERSSLCEAE